MDRKEVKRISHAPERIFLQIGEDELDNDTADVDFHHDVTWCWERIFQSDIEYVRIDHCKGAKPSDGQTSR